MGIDLTKKKEEPLQSVQLWRGLTIKTVNKDYEDTKLGGDSILKYVLNAILIFMIAYSTMECVMTSYDIEYNKGITVIFLVIFGFLMAFMHVNRLAKFIGYVVVLIAFGYMVVSMRLIINTGFSRIVNVVTEHLENEFMLPIIRRFQLYHDDVEMSVAVCLIVIGLVLSLVLNITISEYMNPFLTIIFTFPIAQVGTYMDLPPDKSAMALYMTGIVGVIILRFSRLGKTNVKKESYYFAQGKKADAIICENSPHVSARIGLICIAGALVIGLVVSAIAPGNFTQDYKKLLKRNTNTYVREFAIKGIRMFFDKEGTGGLNEGKLGDVGVIHMDYETDLYVTFVPLSTDRQYIRSYVGATYSSRSWDTHHSGMGGYLSLLKNLPDNEKTFMVDYTSNLLKRNNAQGIAPGIKSKMLIKMVDGSGGVALSPYYVNYGDNTSVYGMSSDTFIYPEISFYEEVELWNYNYPELGTGLRLDSYIDGSNVMSEDELNLETEYYNEVVRPGYLTVPEECKEAVQIFISRYELSEDDPNLVNRLETLFRENYEYSLMPGSTPKEEDYITYFLEKNKKGFCAHFSSAAVMIFRELGIPARYAEGYVIDWGEMQDGRVLDENVSDWIEYGEEDNVDTSKLRVVETQISDAKAHAWTEIYIEGFGWVPVDVTPPRNEDDEYSDGLEGLFNLFGDGTGGAAIMEAATNVIIGGARIALIILVAIVILLALFLPIRMIRVRKRLYSSFSGVDERENMISFFLYIKMLLRAYGHKLSKSMIERDCVRLFGTTVGMNEADIKKAERQVEKAIYSEKLTKEEMKECDIVQKRLQEYVPIIMKNIGFFKKMAYKLWYGI